MKQNCIQNQYQIATRVEECASGKRHRQSKQPECREAQGATPILCRARSACHIRIDIERN